ncbi:MAG: radical SAM protein [Candidatus Methanofastidiosia archaeon]
MIISWNVTNRCNLYCEHCYRDAGVESSEELTTREGKNLIREASKAGFRMIVFSGGEPLMRRDILELTSYARKNSLIPLYGTNGTLLTLEMAKKLKEAGASTLAISLHLLDVEEHDNFCGVKGAFEASLKAMENCRKVGLKFQVNTTAFERNYNDIEKITDIAIEMGASSHHILFMVPTGRAVAIEEETLKGIQYEKLIRRILKKRKETDFDIKPTCAPHFVRIAHQMGIETRYRKGCIAGVSYCSVIPNGDVWPCPYLPIKVGNVKEKDFSEIWSKSPVLNRMRTQSYGGKCGGCEYEKSCSGCRARAYFYHGDYMAEEPWCLWRRGSGRNREKSFEKGSS